jgi:hypothetical protein
MIQNAIQEKKAKIVDDQVAEMIRTHNLSVEYLGETFDNEQLSFTVIVKVSGKGENNEKRVLDDVGVAVAESDTAAALAAAKMKAWTKARRRAVLAFLGYTVVYE